MNFESESGNKSFLNFELKKIGEISTEIYYGSEITKAQLGTGEDPCVPYWDIYTSYDIFFSGCVSFVDKKLIKNPRYASHGDIIIAATSVDPKNIGKCCAYLGRKDILVGTNCFVIKHNQNPKYLAYYLNTKQVEKQKIKLSKQGSVSNISIASLSKIRVKLPPIEIQESIVRILDKFRTLEIELINRKNSLTTTKI